MLSGAQSDGLHVACAVVACVCLTHSEGPAKVSPAERVRDYGYQLSTSTGIYLCIMAFNCLPLLELTYVFCGHRNGRNERGGEEEEA